MIVIGHGGRIGVNSNVGNGQQGSTFYFEIPGARVEVDRTPKPNITSLSIPANSDDNKVANVTVAAESRQKYEFSTALVVDDSVPNRKMMCKLLSHNIATLTQV